MSNWTIGKRLSFGISILTVITIVLGGFAYWRVSRIESDVKAITEDALPGLESISRIDAGVRASRARVFQHMLTTDPQRKTKFEREIDALNTGMDSAYAAYEPTIHDAEERRLFDVLRSKRVPWRQVRDTVVLPLSRANRIADANAAYDRELDPVFQEYLAAIKAEVDLNRQNANRGAAAIAGSVAFTKAAVLVAIAAALGLGGLVGWILTRTTNRVLRTVAAHLSSSAGQVTSASSEVASAAQSLSRGATEQAASIEETSASMEEMASMTRKNAENAHAANGLMNDVGARVNESSGALDRMLASMKAIEDSSTEISKIIKTIDEIAFQTNILALNAAVEAARAGHAGLGFAVVADEVRNLAQRSAQAAKDTAGLIERAVSSARAGSADLVDVSNAVSGIRESVGRVKTLVDDVSLASREQTQGLDQVSQTLSSMEKVTQTTAATAEQSAAASEELNGQAEAMTAAVRELSALVGGAAADAGAPPSPAPSSKPALAIVRRTSRAAEAALPLADTGTYGSF